jgi:chromosome partitioning protein
VEGSGLNLLARFTDPLMAKAERVRNRPFLEATMAASALISCDEEGVSFAKRHALDRVLANVDALKVFDVHLAVDIFNDFVAEIRDGSEGGRARAFAALRAIAGDPEAAELILRISCAIGRADGEARPLAMPRLNEISAALGVASPPLGDGRFVTRGGEEGQPFCVVLGNEKGGTGKSTTAMHVIVALMKRGKTVGSLDLDSRQGSLSRYLENRKSFASANDVGLAMPLHRRVEQSDALNRDVAQREDKERLQRAFVDLKGCDFVVVDCPGFDTNLSRLGHANADMLITPLNDSFLDVDVLAHVDREKRQVMAPSAYCKMVWSQNNYRVSSGREAVDWIVIRNRRAHIDARNNREVSVLLAQLAERIGFRLEHGFGERVIYRELFFKGLTLLDLPEDESEGGNIMSRRHAREEVEHLIRAIGVTERSVKVLTH